MRAFVKAGLPKPQVEYRFHPTRRWRFDYAWPDLKLAVEYEGGTWSGGRHTRALGYAKDCEKYNEAALLGWKVFRYANGMSPMAVRQLGELVERSRTKGKTDRTQSE